MFADRQMRQIVAYAIRPPTPDSWFASSSISSFLPPQNPFVIAQGVWESYPYDPDQARELLDRNQWRDLDGDGFREKNGQRLEARLGYVNYSYESEMIAHHIQAQLNQVGIYLFLTELSFEEFKTRIEGTFFLSDKFDLLIYPSPLELDVSCNLFQPTQEPPEIFRPLSGTFFTVQNIAAYTGYSNMVYDQTCQQLKQTYDKIQLAENYQILQEIFVSDLIALPLFIRPKIVLAQPRLYGFAVENKLIETADIENWRLLP